MPSFWHHFSRALLMNSALGTAQDTFDGERTQGTFMPRSISITFAQLTNTLGSVIEDTFTLADIASGAILMRPEASPMWSGSTIP